MISAREDNGIFLKLSRGENFNDLQSAVELYDIKSGFLEGFGELTHVEMGGNIYNIRGAILFGVISELRGRPYIEVFCYSDKTGKIENFVAENLMIYIRVFGKIKLHSRLDMKGKIELSIGEEEREEES